MTLRSDTYFREPRIYPDYPRARKRKLKLKGEGWSVRIAKGPDGEFEIYKKHVGLMDLQKGHGCGYERPQV
jgi:hypothetical protein